MGVVIPLRPVMPTCERCENGQFLPNGNVFCHVYSEEILEPSYSAEDCPTFETSS